MLELVIERLNKCMFMPEPCRNHKCANYKANEFNKVCFMDFDTLLQISFSTRSQFVTSNTDISKCY